MEVLFHSLENRVTFVEQFVAEVSDFRENQIARLVHMLRLENELRETSSD